MRSVFVAVSLWLAVTIWPCLALAVDTKTEAPVATTTPGKWALTVYGGIGIDGGIADIPSLTAEFNNAYMLDVACSREVSRWWQDRLALEVEVQVAQHFKKQDHFETNLLMVARWMKFPWNNRVRTSFAIGEGISYASSIPTIERERSPDKTSHLLNYMMYELEFAPPERSRWRFIVRVHHRSGAWGTFNDVIRGSNIVGAGVKYRF